MRSIPILALYFLIFVTTVTKQAQTMIRVASAIRPAKDRPALTLNEHLERLTPTDKVEWLKAVQLYF
jgi:hypothetical protein